MAQVVHVQRESRGASISRKGGERHTARTINVTFQVTTDNKRAGTEEVLRARGLPKLGDAYNLLGESNKRMRARQITPVEMPGLPDRWLVAVTYENDDESYSEVEVGFELVRVPLVGGVNKSIKKYTYEPGGAVDPAPVKKWGKAIVNSAGEPFDPPPEVDEAQMVLRVRRNEKVKDFAKITRLTNSTNKLPFMGQGARLWRMHLSAAPIYNDPRKLWRLNYEIVYRRDSWDFQHLDHGRYYLKDGEKIPCKDDEGHVILCNLSQDGKLLADGAEPGFVRYEALRAEEWPKDLEKTIKQFFARGGKNGQEQKPPDAGGENVA